MLELPVLLGLLLTIAAIGGDVLLLRGERLRQRSLARMAAGDSVSPTRQGISVAGTARAAAWGSTVIATPVVATAPP